MRFRLVMYQLTAIVIGLIVGSVARWLLLRHAPGGLPLALLLGTAGAMFAVFLARQFGLQNDLHEGTSMLIAAMGAVVLLFGYRLDLSRETISSSSSPDLNLPQ